jgi:hypothetical protein
MTRKFPFLEIERKTDLLAFAALLIALSSVIYQIHGFFKGPDVKMFPPEQVFIKAFSYYQGAGFYVRFGARLAYVNEGRLGYNDVLRKESMFFSLGGKEYEQTWQAFESFDLKENELISHHISNAHPIPINAGSAVSHETYFAPWPVRCPKAVQKCDKWKNYLKWDDFVKKLESVQELTFRFKSETYSGSTLTTECTIDIDEAFIKGLKKRKWHAPSCWSH